MDENIFNNKLENSGSRDGKDNGPKVANTPDKKKKAIAASEVVSEEINKWTSSVSLGEKLSVSPKTIRKIARNYFNDHPEWFLKSDLGLAGYKYSSELQKIIIEEVQKMKNWKHAGDLKIKGISYQKITEIANKYLDTNPEWFRNSLGGGNVQFSPDLENKIKEDVEKIKNWKETTQVAKEFNLSLEILREISSKYIKENPSLVIKHGNSVKFSPELVEIISRDISNLNKYETSGSLANKLGVKDYNIKSIAIKYFKDHPEWFMDYYRGYKYAPELVDLINQEIEKTKNWYPSDLLVKEFKLPSFYIREYVAENFKDHPEWSMDYYRGYKYAPELVDLLKENIEEIRNFFNKSKTKNSLEKAKNLKEKKLLNYYMSEDGFNYLRQNIILIKNEILASIGKNKIEKYNNYIKKHTELDWPKYSPLISSYFPKAYPTKQFSIDWLFGEEASLIEKGQYLNKKYLTEEGFNILRNEIIKYAKDIENTEGQWINYKYNNYIKKHPELDWPEYGYIAKYYFPKAYPTKQFSIDWLMKKDTSLKESVNLKYSTEEGFNNLRDQIANVKKDIENTKGRGFKNKYNNYIKKHPELDWPKHHTLLEVYFPKIYPTKQFSQNWIFKIENSLGNKNENAKRTLVPKYLSNDGFVELRENIIKARDEITKTEGGWIGGKYDNYIKKHPELDWPKYRALTANYFFTVYPTKQFSANWLLGLTEVLEDKEKKEQQEVLENSFIDILKEFSNPEIKKEELEDIRKLMKMFPSEAMEILFRYYPQYKGLQVDNVKKIIAEYLGDFLVSGYREWKEKNYELALEVIDIEKIKELIIFSIKKECINNISQEKKKNNNTDEAELIERFFQQEKILTILNSNNTRAVEAINEVRSYFLNILKMKDRKPNNIVTSLRDGRDFPDFNQLLNIQEIKEKKKMLIADDMGLGKTGSAILAKEYLGLKRAVVVIPKAVIKDWEGHLTSKVVNAKRLGYFKEEMEPKVLVIETEKDMERLDKEVFDYVLISQEKMKDNYVSKLKNIDFDLLIADEVHGFKNLEDGTWSTNILKLAENIKGEDKYLALLSGTPIPNKIKDVGILLKLLYPEKYERYKNKELINKILNGDLLSLKEELLHHMQAKKIESVIEMPRKIESNIEIEMTKSEREIYNILQEEDELKAMQKIISFRRFLLNRDLIEDSPEDTGSKVKELQKTLLEDLKNKDKIVVFVNDYVEGILRGDDNILEKLNLPKNIIIKKIDGSIENEEREKIKNEFRSYVGKTVLFMFGQVGGVGIDLSAGEEVIFYNDPWSLSEKDQQTARVYREGFKGEELPVKSFVFKDSIEEGIQAYAISKDKAIRKLLEGIELTDPEKTLLKKDSEINTNKVETNEELSKEYMNAFDELLHMFRSHGNGETKFQEWLENNKHAERYADLYKKVGRLSYQGNNARVSATLLEKMIKERNQKVEDLRILDIASGPEMLKNAMKEEFKGNQSRVFSMDINKYNLLESSQKRNTLVSSFLNLPAKDNSLDYSNLSFAIHHTNSIKPGKNYERLQLFAELNRTLKIGGRTMISMIHSSKFSNELKFKEVLNELGLKLVDSFTGDIKGENNYLARYYTLEKINEIEEYKSNSDKYERLEKPKDISILVETIGDELLVEGLDILKVEYTKQKDQKRMIGDFVLNGEGFNVEFNAKDKKLYEEEKQYIEIGEGLKKRFGSIKDISIEEIRRNGFERKLHINKLYLMCKIIQDGGVLVIRD